MTCGQKLIVRQFKPRGCALYFLCALLLFSSLVTGIVLVAIAALMELATPAANQLPGAASSAPVPAGMPTWFMVVLLVGTFYPLIVALGILFRQVWAWLAGMIYVTVNLCLTLLYIVLSVQEVGLSLPTTIMHVLTLLPAVGLLFLLMSISDRVMGTQMRVGIADRDMPRSSDGFFKAGSAYSKQRLWYLAALMWQRAVSLEHSNYGYRRALGAAYVELGQLQAAASELRAADQLNPGDQLTLELLARVHKLGFRD